MNLHRLTILVLLLPAIAQAKPKQHKTSNAPFLKPAEAVARMEFPDAFAVSIFAAEPDIGEPIAFTFDHRGRVWVVENYNYVNRRQHSTDQQTRIQILDDTDGDGVFDTKKLFTDQLTFSSGIAVGFGGVFVGSPPNLQFIPDADGDDVPDGPPEVLLDGWGIHDRHETLNSFIWGPDGWLYGCHGVFTRSLVGKPGAPPEDRQYIDAGIWRYHPVKRDFEVFAHGLSNPWGFDFNNEGQGFATCCVIPHLFHVIQGGTYHKQSKPHANPYVFDPITTIRDHTHLSAHGGARFYLADAFPEQYRGQLFMCNIHQHQVLTDIMVPKGSGYVGTHGEDFLTTNDPAWVGFSVEIGPEGGVYILDWHDTDICGNAINFPNSGRIYRIMTKDAKPIARPNLRAATDLDLVTLQQHPNDWFVRQARTELQHRAATGALDKATVHATLDQQFIQAPDTGKRLRALWAQHVTSRFDGTARPRLLALLRHDDQYVRAWTIQLLCEDRNPGSPALATFLDLARNDPSPVVRLYLAAALQRLPFDQRWPILATLAAHGEDADDHNIPRMLWFALEPMVPAHPAKALELAVGSKIPMLPQHVARRMVSGGGKPDPSAKQAAWTRILQHIAPGFTPHNVGEGGVVALSSFRNQPAVQTHPKDRNTPCSLKRRLTIPKNKTTTLHIRASYHPHGDWQLRALVGKQVLADQIVSSQTVNGEWLTLELDLTPFAGQSIDLTLENRANNWINEFGYWGHIKVVSK